MTDEKRITAFSEAASIASDDFLIIDSPTAGTRKFPAGKLAMASQTAASAQLEGWSQTAAQVHAGFGPVYFPTSSQIESEQWSTYPSSSGSKSTYDALLDVVHHRTATLGTGDTLPVMELQMHYCLPFDTMFSNYQAFLYSVNGLPAGTYNVTMGFGWGTNVVSGKTYQFTLTQALPAGGQLAGFEGAPDQAPSNWRVKAYASQTATSPTETVTPTEGSSGTSLGTFTAAGVAVPASGTPSSTSSVTVGGTTYTYYGLNSLHRVAYGNNRWLHSAVRQYLNSFGYGWWTPATVFDRPPAYVDRQGFLSGWSEDFVAHIRPILRKTALNYVTDGGTSGSPLYDETYDRFTLPSGIEHYLQDTSSYGGAQGQEGVAWDYWKSVANTSSALGWSTWGNTATYHPEYVQYDIASHSTARSVWMRSAGRGTGSGVAYVSSAGYCGNYAAVYGYRVAPACAIG